MYDYNDWLADTKRYTLLQIEKKNKWKFALGLLLELLSSIPTA